MKKPPTSYKHSNNEAWNGNTRVPVDWVVGKVANSPAQCQQQGLSFSRCRRGDLKTKSLSRL
jgi:hypothetical protein